MPTPAQPNAEPATAGDTAAERIADLERLQAALVAGTGLSDVDEALAWAALDAAGVQGAWRDAVVQAGGPRAVLARGALSSFSSPQRRTRILAGEAIAARLQALRPWLLAGGRVVIGDELERFAQHPVACFYGFGDGRVPTRARAPVVAVVGSRQADVSWCARVARLAGALARAGVVVVSGGAPGVDRAAQQAARAEGGAVVVVHGSAARPPLDATLDPGLCWLTPYGPWRAGARHLFAERNAWIAACADVVVVVCGAARSGTRHTVDAALRLRRPVVTLRALADDPLGVIPRRLAARGAPVLDDEELGVEGVRALLATPWWGDGQPLPDVFAPPAAAPSPPPSPPESASAWTTPSPLLRLLWQAGPLLVDAAAGRLCVPVRELLADVALLELDGLVRREGALLQVVLPGEAHATPAAVVLVEPSQQTCAQRPAQAPVPPAHASLPGACAGAIGGASPHELPQPADGAAR